MRRRVKSPPHPLAGVRAWPAGCLIVLAALLVWSANPASANNFTVHLTRGNAHEVKLPAGQAATIELGADVGDIRVADADIVEVAPLSTQRFYLLGKEPGRTTVSVYDDKKAPIGVLVVEVGIDVNDLVDTLHAHIPNTRVKVTTVNGRLRLAGTVQNSQALATVLELAQQYVGSDDFINAIHVKESQQVMLQVCFVEASRSAGKELGVNVALTNPNNVAQGLVTGDYGFPVGQSQNGASARFEPGVGFPGPGSGDGAFRFPLTGNNAFASLITQLGFGAFDLDVIIRALEAKGLGRSLAEPNLTALSGSEATFLAGGEFPFLVNNGDDGNSVEFKEFGVRLTFTPMVLADGLISLKLAPEVSQIDPTNTVDGVPALITRRTETTVELRDGQSFAISGLLQAVTEKQQDQVPWIGSVPILGTLFRSSSFVKRETDLVVIVTPHLVRPAKPGEVLRTPLDGSRNSSEAEFFLAGLMEIDDSALKLIVTGDGVEGPHGHILDLPSTGAHK